MNLRARSRFQSRFSYKPILLRQNSKRVELLWFPQDITESCVCDMSGARTRDSGLCCDMGNTWQAWHVTRSSPQFIQKTTNIPCASYMSALHVRERMWQQNCPAHCTDMWRTDVKSSREKLPRRLRVMAGQGTQLLSDGDTRSTWDNGDMSSSPVKWTETVR